MRLAGTVIRILAEDHDLDLIHRGEVESLEDLASGRKYPPSVSLLLTQKAHQRLKIRFPEFVRQCLLPALLYPYIHLEYILYHILDILDVNEVKTLDVYLLYILDILPVLLGDHDRIDSGPLGCKDLLRDSSHRQHTSAKGHLACHRYSASDLLATESRHHRAYHGYTG